MVVILLIKFVETEISGLILHCVEESGFRVQFFVKQCLHTESVSQIEEQSREYIKI